MVNETARCRRAFGVFVLVVVLAALTITSVAAADTSLAGQVSGHTIPQGNGTYGVVGHYRDASGATGTYVGTYTELSTGYTSCRDSSGAFCAFGSSAGFSYRCNIIVGVITLRSQGRSVTLNIGRADVGPPGSRIQSGVCLRDGDTTTLDTYLMLTNRTTWPPLPGEEFSSRFGIVDYAKGSLIGTSTSRGTGVLTDELAFNLFLHNAVDL